MKPITPWLRRHPYLAVAAGGVVTAVFWDWLFGPRDPRPTPAPVRSAGAVVPVGPEYLAEKLPHYTSAQRCAFVNYLREILPRLGLPAPSVDLYIAHLGRETGFGQSVYDYNFGNRRAFATTNAPWYRHPRNGYTYRAFMSASEGLRDNIDLIARPGGRYAGAWGKLIAGDPTWYSTLGLEGYYEVDGRPMVEADVPREQADYQRSLNGVLACPRAGG